jgi:acetyl-CoA C-acetyltransferase
MTNKEDIVIVDAVRTAIGNFSGGLATMTGAQLGAEVIKSLLSRNKLKADDVSEVIMGQVLTAGVGQNPARQALIQSGIAQEVPAMTINQVCGSGLRAVALAAQQVASGDARIVVAGGQESMSQSPHAAHLRDGKKMGGMEFVDTMLKDGLFDAFHWRIEMRDGPHAREIPMVEQ